MLVPKSISSEDSDNNNGTEVNASDSFSQIGRKQANPLVSEDDLGEYHKQPTTGTKFL